MRIVLALLNLLIGLLALAFIAVTLAWAWPSAGATIWTIGYISMIVLVVMTVVRRVRMKGI